MTNQNSLFITIIMVMTIDGIINQNKHEDSFNWSSREDKNYFLSFIQKRQNVIMGYSTFESINKIPYQGVKHFVLTNRQEIHNEKNSQVEYLSGNPKQITNYIHKKGIQKTALLGGAYTNTQFIEAGLVNDILLTMEPKIFGEGIRLFTKPLNVDLKLVESKQMNNRGTLLQHYIIAKAPK